MANAGCGRFGVDLVEQMISEESADFNEDTAGVDDCVCEKWCGQVEIGGAAARVGGKRNAKDMVLFLLTGALCFCGELVNWTH